MQTLLDDLRIYHQSVYDVQAQIQDTVDGQEAFRNRETLVGRVIQGTLKPLGCGGDRRIQGIYHHITGQGSNTLTSHRISLICHSGRTDLCFLKGLLYLFQVLKETDIVGKLMRAGCNACQNIQHTGVHFSGIGLTGYRISTL